mmetsp:Transcript_17459/g.26910  ORF Transcript_17459/g.26910 Transcript_17459/m.26910 type:complete len:86 (+) Transcript_17459:1004-1261(+)
MEEPAKDDFPKKPLNTIQPNPTRPLKNYPETPVNVIKKQVMAEHQNVHDVAYSDIIEFEKKDFDESSLKAGSIPPVGDSSAITNS